MTRISISTPGFVRSACLAAAAVFALSAVPAQRANAMSPVNPGTAPSQSATQDLLIHVRGGHGGGGGGHGFGGHMGGGHIGGGHFGGGHFGGARFVGGGGWHGARVAHFGGFHRGFHHRRFFYGGYYPYYYPYYHHRCRIVWTYYGPRRVCWHRHWHRWHHWRRYW